MKKAPFLLLIIILNVPVSGQDTISKNVVIIPKNANTIVISGTFSQADKFNEITDILLENGIGIDNSDKETGAITTIPKAFINGTYIITALVKDNKVTIRGQWTWNMTVRLNGVTSTPDPMGDIEYGGQRGSAKRTAWDAFYKLVIQIPGNKTYLVR
jgi:hypothetical protein